MLQSQRRTQHRSVVASLARPDLARGTRTCIPACMNAIIYDASYIVSRRAINIALASFIYTRITVT